MIFSELKIGDWFTDEQGGLFIKVDRASAVNLMTGIRYFFICADLVHKESDMKLSLLFPKRNKRTKNAHIR